MSDPRRLVEEGHLGAALLHAARTLDAQRSRERKIALLGTAGATATAAALLGTDMLPKSAVKLLIGKWVAVSLVVGAIGGVTLVLALSPAPPGTLGDRSPRGAVAPYVAPSAVLVAARGTAVLPRAPSEEVGPAALAPPVVAPLPPVEPSRPQSSGASTAGTAAAPASPSGARRSEHEAPAPDEPLLATRPPAGEAVDARELHAAVPGSAAEPPASAPAADPALAEEVAALQQVRIALAAGQPARALAALDAHDRRFPRGLLGIEAEVLRIEALARSGSAGVASARARRFIDAHPNTPYARRVQAIAGEEPRSGERVAP